MTQNNASASLVAHLKAIEAELGHKLPRELRGFAKAAQDIYRANQKICMFPKIELAACPGGLMVRNKGLLRAAIYLNDANDNEIGAFRLKTGRKRTFVLPPGTYRATYEFAKINMYYLKMAPLLAWREAMLKTTIDDFHGDMERVPLPDFESPPIWEESITLE